MGSCGRLTRAAAECPKPPIQAATAEGDGGARVGAMGYECGPNAPAMEASAGDGADSATSGRFAHVSAATVESHSTVTRVDGRALIDQLEARIARSVPLIEADGHTDADAAQEVPSASTDDDLEAA